MCEYLIGFTYHYPADFQLWQRGVIEDFESSTAVFVTATSLSDALQWASVVATRLLNHVHQTNDLNMHQFGHHCWHEVGPATGTWPHSMSFFQHVEFGEMPVLDRMTKEVYSNWMIESADTQRPI